MVRVDYMCFKVPEYSKLSLTPLSVWLQSYKRKRLCVAVSVYREIRVCVEVEEEFAQPYSKVSGNRLVSLKAYLLTGSPLDLPEATQCFMICILFQRSSSFLFKKKRFITPLFLSLCVCVITVCPWGIHHMILLLCQSCRSSC